MPGMLAPPRPLDKNLLGVKNLLGDLASEVGADLAALGAEFGLTVATHSALLGQQVDQKVDRAVDRLDLQVQGSCS